MNLPTAENESNCPRAGIALYIEGELSPREELSIEKHLAECKSCLDELNLQKKMLSALDFAFEKKEEIEIPKDFTKIVVTRAESNVSGLRSKKERRPAFLLCGAMSLLVLVGFGKETNKILAAFTEFSEQVGAVAGFVFHLLRGVVLGISIILKYLSQQILFNSLPSFLLITGFSIISLYVLARVVLHFNRQYFKGLQEK